MDTKMLQKLCLCFQRRKSQRNRHGSFKLISRIWRGLCARKARFVQYFQRIKVCRSVNISFLSLFWKTCCKCCSPSSKEMSSISSSVSSRYPVSWVEWLRTCFNLDATGHFALPVRNEVLYCSTGHIPKTLANMLHPKRGEKKGKKQRKEDRCHQWSSRPEPQSRQ